MAQLTCGAGGSTGMEVVTQINTNTNDIGALQAATTDLDQRVTTNESNIQANRDRNNTQDAQISSLETKTDDNSSAITVLQGEVGNLTNDVEVLQSLVMPRTTMHTTSDIIVTVTDDPTPIILPVFNAIVTERGGFKADLTNYRLINESAGDQASVIVTIGLNVHFPGTETLELWAYKNGSAYSTATFYLRGTGDNKPNAIFWQSDIPMAEGDYIDIRGRNASNGSVDITFMRTQFRMEA